MSHASDNLTQRRTVTKKGSKKWFAIREGYKSGIPILDLAYMHNVCASTIARLTKDIRIARPAGTSAYTEKRNEAREKKASKRVKGSGVVAGPTYHRGSRWWGGSDIGGTGDITSKEEL